MRSDALEEDGLQSASREIVSIGMTIGRRQTKKKKGINQKNWKELVSGQLQEGRYIYEQRSKRITGRILENQLRARYNPSFGFGTPCCPTFQRQGSTATEMDLTVERPRHSIAPHPSSSLACPKSNVLSKHRGARLMSSSSIIDHEY